MISVAATPQFGLRVSADLALPGDWKPANSDQFAMFKPTFGSSVAAVAYVPLSGGFFLQAAPTLYYNPLDYKDLVVVNDEGIYQHDFYQAQWGLRLPVVAGYDFEIPSGYTLSPFTGVEVEYMLDSKFRPEGVLDDVDMGSWRKPFNLGWIVGVAFPAGHFEPYVSATVGLTKISKNSGITVRQSRVSAGLTYYF